MYKWICILLLLVLCAACKKDNCKQLELATSVCAQANDTALAYQLLVGKWYLRTYYAAYVHNPNYELTCYSDNNNYIEFSANRTISIHGSLYEDSNYDYRDTVIPCELLPATSSNLYMHNKSSILGLSYLNTISVCQNALFIENHNTGLQSFTFTK